jgi:DNA-binding protein HU-beta
MKAIVNVISNVSGLSQKESKKVFDAIITYIQSEVSVGNIVKITGFGKFFSSIRSARGGVNPKTMERVIHPEVKVVRFIAGDTFRKNVRG